MGKRRDKRERQQAAQAVTAATKKQKLAGRPTHDQQLVWDGQVALLCLHSGQLFSFVGEGVLTVQQGCLLVNGYRVTADTPALRLAASAWSSGALQLVAGTTYDQAPLTGQHLTRAVIHSCQEVAAPPGSSSSSASFQLTEGAAGAPGWPVPEEWQQAVTACCQAAASPQALTAAAAAAAAGAAAPLGLEQPPFVAVVVGPKNAGKSSFARLLVNSLLNDHPCVYYLDTDCGQPEYTAPGLVSLHCCRGAALGPAHQHLAAPVQAFFQGDVTPKCEPSLYLHSIALLHATYQQHAREAAAAAAAAAPQSGAAGPGAGGGWAPLVVNTQGWVSGLGLDLLGELLRLVHPTHVVHLAGSGTRRQLPEGCFWDEAAASSTTILQLPGLMGPSGPAGSAGGVSGGGAAADEEGADSCLTGATVDATPGRGAGKGAPSAARARGQQWAAWAAALCGSRLTLAAADAEDYTSIATQLMQAAPVAAPLSRLQVQILHGQVPADQLGYALNGAVVGLTEATSSGSAPGQAAPCLGLGLVRAVNGAAGKVYLLTDLPEEQLQRVGCLQLGRLELPDKLVSSGAASSPYHALFCLAGAGSGAAQMKSRNNLLRQSLL